MSDREGERARSSTHSTAGTRAQPAKWVPRHAPHLGQPQGEEHHLVHELPRGVHAPLVPEPHVLGEDAQVRLPVEEQGDVHPQVVQGAAQLFVWLSVIVCVVWVD